MSAALESNAPIVREELSNNLCFDWELGNKEKTMSTLNSSAYKIDISLVNNRLIPNPMECRSTLGFMMMLKMNILFIVQVKECTVLEKNYQTYLTNQKKKLM